MTAPRRGLGVWTFVVPLALLVLFAAFLRKLDRMTDGTEARPQAQPPATPADPPPLLPIGPGTPATELSLLALIDPSRDGLVGVFAWSERALLIESGTPWSRLEIPYVPPEEYDLLIEVVRRSGANSLNIGLPSGGRRLMIVLDGTGPKPGSFSGLDGAEGKAFFENPTTRSGPLLLPDGVAVPIRCSVRRSGVRVEIAHRQVIQWEGGYVPSDIGSDWKVRSSKTLMIGSYGESFLIPRLQLTPLAGPGTPLRLPDTKGR